MLARAVAIPLVVVLGAAGGAISAQAQTAGPPPILQAEFVTSELSAGNAVANLGSNFLERLGNQATNGFAKALRDNSDGGGASEAMQGPRYRTWGEAYGISTATGTQGFIVGDRRKIWGGVAGLGALVAPGVNVGISVDQSRTNIDVPLALQSASFDLTQLGFNASVDKGPWTWAIALVHGFANINSSRDTGAGIASAGYDAHMDGALTELSYYLSKDQNRIVPKAAIEYVRAVTGSFHEVGGFDPVNASGATAERLRVLIGAEIGHYWIVDQKILDLSAYGKFVDNLVQKFGSVTVSLGPQTITVQGIGESRYGADAGASASLSVSKAARIYLNYDGKFRAALNSHQRTAGIEFKW